MLKHKYSYFCCFNRIFLLKEPEVPHDIKDLFEKYSGNDGMDDEHFHKFLKEVQGEDNITPDEAKSLMQSFIHEHKHLHLTHRKNLDLEGFVRYLFSEVNTPLRPEVHHDMNAPLSHYFIYTSHNTYLKGNQITSKCSDKPIINALKRGVRVIELDMWPNSRKDDVVIKHGGTATRPVKLIKCLRAVKKHAFDASEYPVILTLEDHLTPDLQNKVAGMVLKTFGDMLDRSENSEEFLSPEKLKGKIIISTKPPKEYLETKIPVKEDYDDTSKVHKSEKNRGFMGNLNCCKEGEHEEGDDDNQDENPELQHTTPPNYRSLIAILSRKMESGLEAWLRDHPPNAHRVSLNEEKLEKAITTYGTDIIRFNQKNLMRVYPKASRVDSSNYDPFVGWKHGAQMVAFNTQKHDWSHRVMHGMFRANGGCGYVKKPEFLLKDAPTNELFDAKPKKYLKVNVYMGEGWHLEFHHTHFDWWSPPDFYVKIGIEGIHADPQLKETKTIENNWKPVWNEEFKFPLPVPELAILRVEVHERDAKGKKDDFGGQTCLPVWELKTGIRAVALCNKRGVEYKSVKLLMRFDYV